MKQIALLLICILHVHPCLAQNVLSLHPIYTEHTAVLVPSIQGTWRITDFNIAINIQKKGDNFYILSYKDEKDSSSFEVVFVKINNQLFLDLKPLVAAHLPDEEVQKSVVSGHRICKVFLDKDTMKLQELAYPWFYHHMQENNNFENSAWHEHTLLLNMPTATWAQFLSSHLEEPGMFQPFVELMQVSKQKEQHLKPHPINFVNKEFKAMACLPAFPHVDGWLGGDGDVSVRLNDSTLLWLFSDSWVGKPEQTRKSGGWTMISNSAALSHCSQNGRYNIHYFWRNMAGPSPEPVFQSFTDRYKFWVNDAFMLQNHLYVLLEKIGNKEFPAPDELFNFSLKGFTLAKILNPMENPSNWNIDYIPLPGFANPYMGLRSHAIQDEWIYFFVSRNDQAQLLVRKKWRELDYPEIPFEYYALDKTWKSKLNPQDMDTLYSGFRGTTVRYHPEFKKWIMLSDITFMDHTIKMRTADALTGPWSEETTIYQIPETMPGTAYYDADNFCYLPRECTPDFSTNEKSLLITYDINNKNITRIINNPTMYTPKIIKVPIAIPVNP